MSKYNYWTKNNWAVLFFLLCKFCLLNLLFFRYVISDNRILIKIEDGSYAFEIKNFLVNQERCELVTLEGKDYPGKGYDDVVYLLNTF